MVYKRRSYSRKRYSKPSGSAMATASKALALALMLKKLINVEFKENETYFSATVPSTPRIDLLTQIAQGDTKENRQGNSVRAKSLSLKMRMSKNAAATATIVRVLIVQDKVSNGVVPITADLFDTSSAPAYMAPYNSDNAGNRFKFLRDKTYILSDGGGELRLQRLFNKLNHHVKWNGTTGVQAQCQTGHLYLITISSESTNVPNIEADVMLRYVDN